MQYILIQSLTYGPGFNSVKLNAIHIVHFTTNCTVKRLLQRIIAESWWTELKDVSLSTMAKFWQVSASAESSGKCGEVTFIDWISYIMIKKILWFCTSLVPRSFRNCAKQKPGTIFVGFNEWWQDSNLVDSHLHASLPIFCFEHILSLFLFHFYTPYRCNVI